MHILSSAFQHELQIPKKYTCDGEDLSPPLDFDDIPNEAKSLVLIVHDPDAVSKDWVHWTVFNMKPSVRKIEEGQTPEGIEGTTDAGEAGYHGPCPPSGEHRYYFRLYTLDTLLSLDRGTDRKKIESAMQGHILDQSVLMGTYTRKNKAESR